MEGERNSRHALLIHVQYKFWQPQKYKALGYDERRYKKLNEHMQDHRVSSPSKTVAACHANGSKCHVKPSGPMPMSLDLTINNNAAST